MTDFITADQVLPLRPLTLNGAPISKRAITWSADAELAVASDDAVHVFAPQFPKFSDELVVKENNKADGKEKKSAHGSMMSMDGGDDDGDNNNDNGDEEDEDGPGYEDTEDRRQFATGWKHIPVSAPLDPRINAHLYENIDQPFPFAEILSSHLSGASTENPLDLDADTTKASIESDLEINDDPTGYHDFDNDENMELDQKPSTETSTFISQFAGTGEGTMTAAAATMNSVVSIAWSPSGLGRNGRCVLGVLTSAGVLTIYGEAARKKQVNVGQKEYDISSWEILWAVGDRMVVPPQQEIGECITSFAWAGEIGRGKALLAYQNDQKEVVLLVVQVEFKTDDELPSGSPGNPDQGLFGRKETATWRVKEVARKFSFHGPHPREDMLDPDYVPFRTAFSLSFSPWCPFGTGKASQQAALAYITKNYVGFRKIKIPLERDWPVDGVPEVEIEEQDITGLCIFMSSDVFVEWEQATWSRARYGKEKVCRGVIVTPFVAKPFEFQVNQKESEKIDHHSVGYCSTRYPGKEDQHTNPITGIAINHPNPSRLNDKPTFTAVRLSATAQATDWHITNFDTLEGPTPIQNNYNLDWIAEITQRLDVAVPVNLPADFGVDDKDDDPTPLQGELIALPNDQPEVHLNRIRIWGLAASPGGGVTAVVVTLHSAQHPDRGDFRYAKSKVLFTSQPSPGVKDSNIIKEKGKKTTANARSGLVKQTTEARMFEWMYGGGAGVPALLGDANSGTADAKVNTALRKLFKDRTARALCGLCRNVLTIGRVWAECKNGHWHDVCGVSGVPILKPGLSKACGVCGGRNLRKDVLVGFVKNEDKQKVEEMVGEGCGRCGGKFVD